MPDNDIDTILSEAFRRLNEISRRLRTSEERLELVETNVSSNKDALIKSQADFSSSVERLGASMKNFDERVLRVENEIVRINKVLEKTAKSIEVDELRGTISLLSPLQSKILTEQDVRRIISDSKEKSK